MVWADDRTGDWNIYGYDLRRSEKFTIAAQPGNQLDPDIDGLHWQDNANDEAGYQIERASGITDSAWTELVTLSANVTVYTDTPGVLGESHWYRVRAFNTAGVSAYANESFNSTFAAAPMPMRCDGAHSAAHTADSTELSATHWALNAANSNLCPLQPPFDATSYRWYPPNLF